MRYRAEQLNCGALSLRMKKPHATVPLRMRMTCLRIVDEMQSREVELWSLVLLFLLPVRFFDVLQILFPLPRLLVCSAVLHRSQIKS
jgi:hypothetical protein